MVGKMDARLKKLDRIFAPRSIAVVGASTTPAKVGNVVIKNFIDG
jgi:acyl-CoA synthetase (NDP forming)